MISNNVYFRNSNYTFLYFILVFQILFWLFLKPVWPFSDDYLYAHNAFKLIDGSLQVTANEFSNRFGIYVPTSVFFFLFGVSPFSVALWSLIINLALTILVYFIVSKLISYKVAIVASLLLSTNVLLIAYSAVLFPDIFIAFYTVSIVLLCFYARSEGKSWIAFVIASFFLFGIFTKETIFFVVPLFLGLFIYDIWNKKNPHFWRNLIIGISISFLLFLFFYYLLTGDPFFRIKNILFHHANNSLNDSLNLYTNQKYGQSDFFIWLNSQLGLVFIFIFSIPFFIRVIAKERNVVFNYLFVSFASILLVYLLFFAIPKYHPLIKWERLWLFLIPFLSIFASITIVNNKNKTFLFLFLCFLFLGIYNLDRIGLKRSMLFFAFSFVCGIVYLFVDKFKKVRLLLLLPFFLLTISFVLGNTSYRFYTVLGGGVPKAHLDSINSIENAVVYVNSDFRDNHIIYNQFREFEKLKFLTFDSLNKLNIFNQSVFLLKLNNEKIAIPKDIFFDTISVKENYLLLKRRRND